MACLAALPILANLYPMLRATALSNPLEDVHHRTRAPEQRKLIQSKRPKGAARYRAAIRARREWKSRETDVGLVSLVDVNGINEAYAADRSGHH
jgi:hypothetical protein